MGGRKIERRGPDLGPSWAHQVALLLETWKLLVPLVDVLILGAGLLLRGSISTCIHDAHPHALCAHRCSIYCLVHVHFWGVQRTKSAGAKDNGVQVPSSSFKFLQVPSSSFEFLRVPSISFKLFQVPSSSFQFLQVPTNF